MTKHFNAQAWGKEGKSEKKEQDLKCKKGGKGKDEGIEGSRERERLCVCVSVCVCPCKAEGGL